MKKDKDKNQATKVSKTVENSDYKPMVVDGTTYKTTLNKMFTLRKSYVPVDPKKIFSFMPGTIEKVFIKVGNQVKAGDTLLILEAMKMKNNIVSKYDGIVKTVLVEEGKKVANKQLLIEFE